jgi:hypothetical protein
VDADPLPRCPHGNEAVICDTPVFAVYIVAAGGTSCQCRTQSDTPDRARRAWVALCSAD